VYRITTGAYGIAALLWLGCALRADRHAPAGQPNPYPRVAATFSGILFLLGVNKLYGLLTRLERAIAAWAWGQGFYQERGEFQQMTIAVILILGVAALLGILLSRPIWREHWPAALSLFLLIGLVLVRAVSLHAFDALLNHALAGWKLNWIFELGLLLALVALALAKLLHRKETA
jgi:hypothetical protein